MSKFSNTSAISTFKLANGIASIKVMVTESGKPYFKTNNGIEGKMSEPAHIAIKAGDLSNVRISTFDPEDGKDSFFMIHLTSSDESAHTVSCTI